MTRRPRDNSPAAPRRALVSQRALQTFYLATPGFVLLDLVAGINLRTTFLDEEPGLKLIYYAIAFGCGLAVTRWPARSALIGLLESGTNIVWLILGIALRYLTALDAALADQGDGAPPFTPAEVVNLLVSAGILMVSYTTAQSRLGRELR